MGCCCSNTPNELKEENEKLIAEISNLRNLIRLSGEISTPRELLNLNKKVRELNIQFQTQEKALSNKEKELSYLQETLKDKHSANSELEHLINTQRSLLKQLRQESSLNSTKESFNSE
mmetsp:Transcript_2084/g.3331  ORF Transcript_2084/g.3331 Transcript_2084/m.3331 type:complete len:118 (+) Transcript_2084:911-1264(+)